MGFRALRLLLAVLAAPQAAFAAPPTSVRFVYDEPVVDFAVAPIAVAEKLGFYARHGVETEMVLPPDSQTTARMLATGQGDIGFQASTDVIFAANASIPLQAIGNFVQSNSWCLIGRPGEAFNPSALHGLKIGIFTDSWTGLMMAALLKNGHDQAGSIQQIITQVDDIPLVLSRRIDLATNVAAYGLAEIIEQTGKPPTLACGSAIGVPDIPVWVFAASPAWLRQNGETARRWLAATREGLVWSIAHPKEAATIFTRAYPLSGSELYNTIGWTYLSHSVSGPNGPLIQQPKQWQTLAALAKALGQIQSVHPPSYYFTNDFLKD